MTVMAGTNARTRAAMNKTATPAPAPQPAPAKDEAPKKVDFLSLVSNAQEVEELPKIGGRSRAEENAFTEKVKASFESGKPYRLPAIPKEALTPVRVAIRRGATLADLGVSIREEETDAGVVLTFLGKVRNKRNADK